MLIYKTRFLTVAEVWFDNAPGDTRAVDWILYHQRSQPVPGSRCVPFYTYLIDLTQPSEKLLAHMKKEAAKEIRRARDRDGVVCQRLEATDPAIMDQFEAMYDRFATGKGMLPMRRAKLEKLAALGALDLAVARDAQGTPLVYHVNYWDPQRASGLITASLYREAPDSAARNAIGRANRLLDWTNMLRYREQGLKCYDFGGWYCGSDDEEQLKINAFKKGYGGQVRREYKCERILTLKGWTVLTAAKCLKRAGLWRARPQTIATRSGLIKSKIATFVCNKFDLLSEPLGFL